MKRPQGPQGTHTPVVASPCSNNCTLNAQQICIACLRTIEEIIDWERLSSSEKQSVLNECSNRRALQGKA